MLLKVRFFTITSSKYWYFLQFYILRQLLLVLNLRRNLQKVVSGGLTVDCLSLCNMHTITCHRSVRYFLISLLLLLLSHCGHQRGDHQKNHLARDAHGARFSHQNCIHVVTYNIKLATSTFSRLRPNCQLTFGHEDVNGSGLGVGCRASVISWIGVVCVSDGETALSAGPGYCLHRYATSGSVVVDHVFIVVPKYVLRRCGALEQGVARERVSCFGGSLHRRDINGVARDRGH